MRPPRRETEANEIRWWSNWAKLRWRGDGYLLTSTELKEPFFNRGGSLTCGGVLAAAGWTGEALSRRGVDSTFLALESCSAVERLLSAGYRQVDAMKVLYSKGPLPGSGDVETSSSAERWTSAYLRSFYGDEGIADVVGPIVASLLKKKEVTLLESKTGAETTGVQALYRTRGLAGVYCVGTVPEHRNKGAATRLLGRARSIASDEGRTMILQTLESDGVLQFYLERGFEVLYTKLVMARRLK